ncbi:LPD7 domain-containing protein [Snodgrassella sp.]|uniref:LPD7 domain-containing protein n=1 Tax=Snodgrassella sp. TaxID=2815304 RepID=UPI00258E8F95|nr:LPD7 domain-containing protein [Snodgrassella sp.]MCO6525504.1 PriCT-2 domain-containing protein [Snodgrassella sp.]
MSDIDEIRSALTYLDAHSREMWVKIGSALKDELGEQGFDIWDNWSQTSDNYNARAAKSVWKSLKRGNIHISSLFYEAKNAGYKPTKPYTPPSAEEVARRKAEAEQRRLAEAEATRKAQSKAEKSAQQIWAKNKPASASHPYLVKKGITDPAIIGQLRQGKYKGNDNLLIPVLQDKKIVSMQFINQDGAKRFLAGGRMQGSYTFIGDTRRMNQGVIMAEGVATAASIYQATGIPVIVAFNAGNLRPVAEKLVQTLPPETPVIIAADNDASKTGITHARQAASLFGQQASVIMPEFSNEQIATYQARHGKDTYPSDFNDLHALAGLDTVKQALLPELAPSPEPEPAWPKPVRTAWNDFPPVIRNGAMGELKNEAEYTAAKGGDEQAAMQLVAKLITADTVAQVNEMIDGHVVTIVPVSAIEASGENQIPRAMATVLAKELDLPVDHNILQANKVNRTGSGIDHRLAFQPLFTGAVTPGQEYLLIDDTLSVGSTLANLKGYIETNGGKVIGAAVMTAHEGALNIAIKPDMINAITRKHGNSMNNFWKKEFGYEIDKLTQGEAGHVRKAQNVEQIRDRILAAQHATKPEMDVGQLHKAVRVQQGQQVNQQASTQKLDSVLSEPPTLPDAAIKTTAQPAVFFRPEEEATMATTAEQTVNSIELDNRQQPDIEVTASQPDPAPESNPKPKIKQAASEPEQATATEPNRESPKAKQTEKNQTQASSASEKKQPITDLKYKAPPDHLADRYIVANGQYLSIKNGTTVLFEDKGRKISTARADAQTIRDMLEVAKSKGWDSIKLSGTPEFKSMMYVAAESQGIRTRGYKPTPADLALVEKLRNEQSLNSIEPDQPKQELTKEPKQQTTPKAETQPGERLIAHGSAPYLHVSTNQDSYYVTLEKNGRERTLWGTGLAEAINQAGAKIGDSIKLEKQRQQAVTIQIPERDQNGQVIGQTEKQVNRNLFSVEILQQANQQSEPAPQPEPDYPYHMSDNELMNSYTEWENYQTNAEPVVSELADNEPNQPSDELPNNVDLQTAKHIYMNNAAKLNSTGKAHLQFYERATLDALRGLDSENLDMAMKNYYVNTAKAMTGSQLNLPRPIQIPSPGMVQEQQQQQQQQQQTEYTASSSIEPEIER